MDKHVFIEHVDPDWRDHFLDVDQAFDHYVQYLSLQELAEAIHESGCRDE